MNILHLNTYDEGGGAEGIARRLNDGYAALGHLSRLAVKRRKGHSDRVLVLPEGAGQGVWGTAWFGLAGVLDPFAGKIRGAAAAGAAARALARPRAWWDTRLGREDFRFPGTAAIPSLTRPAPDILQCHNLHGGYFDLGALPELSRRLPVVLTVHDGWLFSGHCAHSLDCERWRTGCGGCPHPDLYPAIRRDASAANWRLKKAIFENSRLWVACPSKWLLDRVFQSVLASAVVEGRVVENGIDDAFFMPRERDAARAALGIARDARVLLFVANGLRHNPWKDSETLARALARLGAMRPVGSETLALALGDTGPESRFGPVTLKYAGYVRDPMRVADHYAAADVYVHAAKVETFSLTIAEAMAVGRPVVASAVGAVGERVRGLDHPWAAPGTDRYGTDRATGILVEPGQAEAMAASIDFLLGNAELSSTLGKNAAQTASARYRSHRQCETYLTWFEDIMTAHAEQKT